MLYLLLVCGLVTAAHPTPESTDKCKAEEGREGKAGVDGWPMVAALQLQEFRGSPLQLQLSHNQTVHTTLTLDQPNPPITTADEVSLLSITVNQGLTNLSLSALVKPQKWAWVKVGVHQRRLVVGVTQETEGVTYTSRITHEHVTHYPLDTVSYIRSKDCVISVDLQCLKDQREKDHKSGRRNGEADSLRGDSKSTAHALLWPFLAVLFLLVLASALYLTWRAQRKKIKQRKELVKAMMARKHSEAKEGSQANSKESSRERSPENSGTISHPGNRVQYSSILMGYDGPCTLEDEAT